MPSRNLRPIHIIHLLLILVLTAGSTLDVCAQDAPPPDQNVTTDQIDKRLPWNNASALEAKILDQMLASQDWAFRAIGLMRLERYKGEAVNIKIKNLLSDEAWQIRCYAIRHAFNHSITIDGDIYVEEMDARVTRTALLYGVAIPDEVLDNKALQMLNTKTVDALLMGIEIAASSNTEKVRRNASKRTLTLVKNMNSQVAAVISRRLAAVLQVDPEPENLNQWHQWVSTQNRNYQLPRPTLPRRPNEGTSLIATADEETFIKLRDYLSVIRERDLDLVLAIDATASMRPMIDAVKADIDALVLFLSDISSTLRLGLIAYRDHDNVGKLIEAHRFSTDLSSLRNFLFGLQTPGGNTYPEAVLDGIRACGQFKWNEKAEREIILIGDAPPHDADGSELRSLLDSIRQQGYVLHAVHVPMQPPPGLVQRMTEEERKQYRQEYNETTMNIFQQIANMGGGQLVELDTSKQIDLVRSIMKLTIQREWWPYFDVFYDSYLELCR